MMPVRNVVLVDPSHRDSFKPLSWTRPVAELRIGILTIAEKWRLHLNAAISYQVPAYLNSKYTLQLEEDNILLQGHLLPSRELIAKINDLKPNEFLVNGNNWVAARLIKNAAIEFLELNNYSSFPKKELDNYEIRSLQNLWEIFQWNDYELNEDYELITRGRVSAEVPQGNTVKGERIFIEDGAEIHDSIINTYTGPVYVGAHAVIMEGCMIRGGLALCDHSQLKMGTKIYGATTVGPDSRVGGEVNNSVIIANSNKAHDGFLGNSVIGAWCNLGADSNNSNLKNNYEEVKLWNYTSNKFIPTGTIFCGLIMGDHAKCGINTMFNTGTIVGYGANVFGAGFPRQYVPEFAWGGASGFTDFKLDKFIQTAEAVMQRRNKTFDKIDQDIARYIYEFKS
jgi:UDP-N-acetylglucosamine diphosphorylase/glucosamine-1-phosphate N-acetyltransferase